MSSDEATPTGSGPPSPATPADSTAPPLSSKVPPTMKPPKPPKTPSDLVPHDLVVGRVTRGGTGPCYGLVTDEGTEYALHSTAGITLKAGTWVRVRYAPLKIRIYCGPGRHVRMLEATVIS
jgi:hypothetical protein